MLRSLTSRLVAAFLAVAVVVLLAAGGALFVVLRGLHADATTASLEDVAGSVVPQVRDAIGTGDLRGTILEVRDELVARQIQVMVIATDGRLRPIGGLPVGDPVLASDLDAGATAHGRVTIDGVPYLWVATGIRRAAAVAPRAIAFVEQDRSAGLALADVLRAIPAVLVVTALVAAPLAWLLARSVTRPLRTVAAAAARLPSVGHVAVALEGPVEVRDLTATFNAMAGELDDTRRREAELLANLRHDLRTPLTVISGFATALRDGTARDAAAAAAARAIEEEAGRLEHLVDQLGDVEAARDPGAGLRPQPLDAVEVAAAAVERFRERAGREGVALDVSPAPGGFDPEFTADPVAVERMLGNLVANAITAVGNGGHVRIEVADAQLPAPTGSARPAIAIDVIDDGPGFPLGSEAHAFERFWRGDPARVGGGSGLGLAIVQELARAHGGDARAANAVPSGARVGIVLPRPGPVGSGGARGPADEARQSPG